MTAGAARAVERAVPQRVAVPFLLALLGVLAALGVAVHALAGGVGLAAYAVAVAALLGGLGRTARRLVRQRAARPPASRTCSCCTGSHSDPVEVI